MYIIIAGGGKVGFYLAKTLLAEGHEILIIEMNPKKVDRIAEDLGSVAMRGDACEAATLAEAGTGRCDMVIAVTGDDEDNLVICQVAKHKFNVPRAIARINNPKNEEIFKHLGIDVTVNTTDVILQHIEHEVPTHPLIHLFELKSYGLEIVDVKIPPDAPVVNRSLREISLPPHSLVAAIISARGAPHVPDGDTVVRANDEIVAVTRPENEAALRRSLTGH
ncbi:MAG: TrkA family potassium uptake protein [Chloroflexi bacterium]|nr:TrkA family potassium uptake protein [Chloroflexota bacterium]